MTLSSIQLRQMISARVSSTGLQRNIKVGGSNSYTVPSTVADVVHSFSIKFAASDDTAKWNVDTGIITTNDDTNVVISGGSQANDNSSVDVTGTAITTITKIAAIYYETPAQASWVLATATDSEVGTIKLSGDGSNIKSALIVPYNKTASGIDVDFTCGGATTIKVVYLAKA